MRRVSARACQKMTRLVCVLESLVPTAVQLLLESVCRHESDGRGILVYLVRVLPLLNREARDLWRKEWTACHLLTFCDFLFGTGHRGRYLDGVLPEFENDKYRWTKPLEPLLVPNAQRVLALESVHKNRTDFANLLESRADAQGSGWAHDSADLERDEDGVSLETARTSLRFMRFIVQTHEMFRQHPSYTRHFGTCQRVGCVRPALLTPPDTEPDDDEDPSAAEYWKCCRDGRAPPPTSSLPTDMSFCCYGCYKATNAEFKRVVKFDIVTPVCDTRHGAPPTPSRLYRAAVKRNVSLARSLRMQEQVKTKHYPSTMANRDQMQREQTTMLSVDLGVLYVASIVNELPTRLRPNRSLPRKEDWRNQASPYLGAVCKVRAIYMKYGRGELARGGEELWLKRLRDEALHIF